jgi:tetratricopeptide (TPR) repeat protein
MFFLKLAEEAKPKLIGPTQRYWLEKLDQEKDNCRSALHWLLRNDIEAAARLVDSLFWFWHTYCYWSEGREWCDQILKLGIEPDGNKTLTKARLAQMLWEAGWLALDEMDTSQGQLLSDQSLSLYRELGDKKGIALALTSLGWAAYYRSDFSRARNLAEESLGLLKDMGLTSKYEGVLTLLGHIARVHGSYDQATQFYKEAVKWSRETGNKQAIAYALSVWGYSALLQGDLNQAGKLSEESLQFSQEVGLEWNIADTLLIVGDIARIQGEYENASKLYDECDEIWQRLGHPRESGYLLCSRGWLARVQGDHEKATGFFKQGLRMWQEVGDKRWIAECLEGLAGMALDIGKTQLAAKLLGVAERIREEMNSPLSPVDLPNHEQDVGMIRSALGEFTFIKAWEDGKALTIERAIEYALEVG